MTQLTAETITDDQIRELRDQASRDRDVTLHNFACDALGLTFCRDEDRPTVLYRGRARCAEVLNARKTDDSMTTPTVFNILAQQYRDWCVSNFGATNGLQVANDALRTAMVAVADKAFDTFEPGDYVLVWKSGAVPGPIGSKARRRLVAWGPPKRVGVFDGQTRPLTNSLIEDVQDHVRVIWERA